MIKPYPVAVMEPTSQTERFAAWARRFGIFRLARSLQVDARTVRHWLDKSTIKPRIDHAKAIIALSTVEPLDGNPLTFEDIYGAALVARVEIRHVQKVKEWE